MTLAIISNIVALFLFFFGLLAPLTPSEGFPANWLLVFYIAFPLILLGYAWFTYNHPLTKNAVLIEMAIILAITLYLSVLWLW